MRKMVITAGALAAVIASSVNASIALDDAGKVKISGDFRLRAEMDERTKFNNGANEDRNRLRYRARFGISFKVNNNWSAKFRLATNTSSINSPHVTFGDDPDIDYDQAYLSYSSGDMKIGAGKQPLNYWNSSEMVWDKDFNPDAISYAQKFGDIKINAAHIIINEGSWGNGDDTIEMLQAVYSKDKLTIAAGYFNNNNNSAAKAVTIFTAQYKASDWRAVIELADSDANTEGQAYALQFRKGLSDDKGVRIYYMYVEAQATPGDGKYGQDDFPDQNGTGLSNFKGFRLQYDQKIDKHTAMDIRLYTMEAIDAAFASLAASGNPYFADDERLRLQLNINLKF